jgi:hypothetical protein
MAVTQFRAWPDLVQRGWGVMHHSGGRWQFVPQMDRMVGVPGISGPLHRAVAPLAAHLLRWLVEHRGRALDAHGSWGLAVRPIRGREAAAYAGQVSAWSNHAAGVAFDIEAPRNPLGVAGRGDFPEGWKAECHRWGFAWGAAAAAGGDYVGRPDRMHVEFIGTPADAAEYVAALGGTPPPVPDQEELTRMRYLNLDNPSGATPDQVACLTIDPVGTSLVMPVGSRAWVQWRAFFPGSDAAARLDWLVFRFGDDRPPFQMDPRTLKHGSRGAVELQQGVDTVEVRIIGIPRGGSVGVHVDGLGHA